MKYRGYRVDVTLAVALLTLAVLLGARLAYARFLVERPLATELKALEGVQSVVLERSGAGYRLQVKLGEVKDLPGLYRQIEKLAAERLGPGNFALKIQDERTPALENVYYRIHYYLEEALTQGNFSTAAAKIHSEAQAAGIEERFYVDEGHIYLQLLDGPAYLYEVRYRPRVLAGERMGQL
ncbi:MAG: hypothetical protein PWP12_67 [Bacillota bacterium]|jgi:hypothetical protein|nr:hypothetical protein [Bacillota bacterium]